MKRAVWAVAAILTITGCTALSPRAARIQVHPAGTTQVQGCSKLGPVSAKEGGWHTTVADMQSAAKDKMREAVADQYPSADTVVMVDMDQKLTSSTATGIAYKCF